MAKIGIIGLGNMGQAVADAISNMKTHSVIECGRNDDKNEKLKPCDFIIIAVKPQDFKTLADSISIDLSGKLCISIMAGVSVQKIKDWLNVKRVVRSMPNLPVQVGKGVVGWYASKECSQEDNKLTKDIFLSMGMEVKLSKEEMIDAITVISGSGPAYFFYLSEAMQDAAEELGFSKKDAEKIVKNTFLGAAKILKRGDKDVRGWRRAVTSKKGVTEASTKYFDEKNMKGIIVEALKKAHQRAQELK